jgi:cbb3-type cytochrome oxidase maturation protein
MEDFLYLVPIALILGLIGLGAFMWTLRSGQYDDLDGAAERVLLDHDDRPILDDAPQGSPPDKAPQEPKA